MAGRNTYLVAYDICESSRLRRVYKKMRGYGDPLQYSLFRCRLSRVERELMITSLTELIAPKEDRVMIVDLGPQDGKREERLQFLGRPLEPIDDGPVVF